MRTTPDITVSEHFPVFRFVITVDCDPVVASERLLNALTRSASTVSRDSCAVQGCVTSSMFCVRRIGAGPLALIRPMARGSIVPSARGSNIHVALRSDAIWRVAHIALALTVIGGLAASLIYDLQPTAFAVAYVLLVASMVWTFSEGERLATIISSILDGDLGISNEGSLPC